MIPLIQNEYGKLKDIFAELNDSKYLKLLGLDKNDSILKDDWEYFKNTIGSIDAIQQQNKNLKFIGFIGHSGAGKSSLLNAIMNIKQSESKPYKRPVGETFTDRGITLIVHPDNRKNIEKSNYSNSEFFTIITGPEDEYFKNLVLVDTPGLGNEEIETKIVESFLHMCHLIILTMNGERPFGNKDEDFKLLDLKLNKLKGIPSIITITKAEHFILNIVENNKKIIDFNNGLDTTEITRFWDEVLSLIIQDKRFENQRSEIDKIERFYVDSNVLFNIDELKNSIHTISENTNNLQQVEEARLYYFKLIGRAILNKFKKHLTAKSIDIKDILDGGNERKNTAYSNIEGELSEVKKIIDSITASQTDSINESNKKLNELKQNLDSKFFQLKLTYFYDDLDYISKKRVAILESNFTLLNNLNTNLSTINSIDTIKQLSEFNFIENLINEQNIFDFELSNQSAIESIYDLWYTTYNENVQTLIENQKTSESRIVSRNEIRNISKNKKRILDKISGFFDIFENYIDMYRNFIITPNNLKLFKEIGEILLEEKDTFNNKYKIDKNNEITIPIQNIESLLNFTDNTDITINVIDNNIDKIKKEIKNIDINTNDISKELLFSNDFLEKYKSQYHATINQIKNNINNIIEKVKPNQNKINIIESERKYLFTRSLVVFIILSAIYYFSPSLIDKTLMNGIFQNGIIYIFFALVSFLLFGFQNKRFKTAFTFKKQYIDDINSIINECKITNTTAIQNMQNAMNSYYIAKQKEEEILNNQLKKIFLNSGIINNINEQNKDLILILSNYHRIIKDDNEKLSIPLKTLISDLRKYSEETKNNSIEPLMNTINDVNHKVNEFIAILNKKIEQMD